MCLQQPQRLYHDTSNVFLRPCDRGCPHPLPAHLLRKGGTLTSHFALASKTPTRKETLPPIFSTSYRSFGEILANRENSMKALCKTSVTALRAANSPKIPLFTPRKTSSIGSHLVRANPFPRIFLTSFFPWKPHVGRQQALYDIHA